MITDTDEIADNTPPPLENDQPQNTGDSDNDEDIAAAEAKSLSLISALVSALENIKNCLKSKGKDFTDTSLANFKKNNSTVFTNICDAYNEIDNTTEEICKAKDWFRIIRVLIKTLSNETLDNSLLTVISKLTSLPNNTLIIDKQEDSSNTSSPSPGKDQLILSIIASFHHIQKCLTSTGNYTDQDLSQFKEQQVDHFKTISKAMNRDQFATRSYDSATDWFNALAIEAECLGNKTVRFVQDETYAQLRSCPSQTVKPYMTKAQNINPVTNYATPKFSFENPKEVQSYHSDSDDDKTSYILSHKPQHAEKFRIKSSFKTASSNPRDSEQDNFRKKFEMPPLETTQHPASTHTQAIDSLGSIFEKMGNAFLSNKPLRLDTLKNPTQNVREWFNKFEIQTVQYDTTQKGFEVIKWIEDTAFHYWQMMPPHQRYNYIYIKEHLIKKFTSPDQYFHSKASFYSMKQETHETVDEYAYRLYSCRQDWPTSDLNTFDTDLLKVFKHNVNPEIAKQLVTAHFNSFDSLTQKARSIEKLIKVSTESTTIESPIFTSNTNTPSKTNNCFKCQDTGHIAKDCPTKTAPAKPGVNKLFCVICGKTNHLAIKCFQWKRSIKRTDYPHNNTKQYCTHCKRNNHDTANCRRLKHQKQTPPSGPPPSTTTNALND